MQLKSLVLLGTLLPAGAFAASAKDSVPIIYFCSEDTMQSFCHPEAIKDNECRLIPDSNATGDKGSSAWVYPYDGSYKCMAYLGDNLDCNIDAGSTPAFSDHHLFNVDITFRSYKCWPA